MNPATRSRSLFQHFCTLFWKKTGAVRNSVLDRQAMMATLDLRFLTSQVSELLGDREVTSTEHVQTLWSGYGAILRRA